MKNLNSKKQNHTSHRTLHTSQKGITLIALIITIIVMLILVGVTINVALNGGLFQKAEYASEQMQIKADEEELLSAVMGAIGNDGKINFEEIQLPEGWDEVAEKTYKSSKDNVYEVDDYGKITYKGKNEEGVNTPTVFKWESLGLRVDTATEYENTSMNAIVSFSEDGKLKLINTDGEIMAEIDASNPKNIIDGIINCQITIGETPTNIKVKMNEQDSNDEKIYIEAQGQGTIPFTKVAYDNVDVYSNEEVLKMLGETGGTYTGTWTVIERDENGKPTKLVSTRSVASCTLGEYNNLDKSISDYKNAVSILNTSAQESTGITSARSITVEDIETLAGIQDSDKGDLYNKPYTYNYTNHKDQVFVNESGATVKLEAEGKEVTLKHTYYYKDLTSYNLGTLASGYYWLASPCLNCNSGYANFGVRYLDDGYVDYRDLFNSNGYAYGPSSGVRAVVSI